MQTHYEELLNIALSIEAIPEVLRLYDLSDPSHSSAISASLDKTSRSSTPLGETSVAAPSDISANPGEAFAAPLDNASAIAQSLKMPRRLFKEVAVVIGKHVHDSKEAYARVPELIRRGVEMGMYPRQDMGLAG